MTVVGLLELVRGNIPERLQQAPRVVPRQPTRASRTRPPPPFPWPVPPDLFRLVQADDRFRQRVVVGIAGAADRGLDAGLGEAWAVVDRADINGIQVLVGTPAARP